MNVKDLMTYPILTVRPDTSVFEAITSMALGNKGSALVSGDGFLKEVKGIVTTTGIFRHVISKGIDPKNLKVSEIMTSAPLITISPNASTREAALLMRKYDIRRLPVVERGALVGIITSKDLLNCVGDS